MSEGTQNIGDEQAVVGEPASHLHQAVVVGEPPEAVAPVLGEPAFANGLQDQQPILPLSAEETSANGVQASSHIPPHEEGLVSSSDVSILSSATPVEESLNLQHSPSAETSESGLGEADTRQLEPVAAEDRGLSGSPVNEVSGASAVEVSGASDAPVPQSTAAEIPVNANTHAHDTVHSAEEEPAVDTSDAVEITHIVDSPSEAPPSLSEVPTDNPFTDLDEEGSATAYGEIVAGAAPSTDGAPTTNVSSTPDEIPLKGLGDQQEEASSLSAVQGKQTMENSSSVHTDTDEGALEGSKAANEVVEPQQVGQGDTVAQDADSKEANSGKEETNSSSAEPQLDHTIERNDTTEDTVSETSTREAGHNLSKDVPQSEASTVESATVNKDIANENHTAPVTQSNEEALVEAPAVVCSVAPQGTRDIAAEECSVNHPPAEEVAFPLASNGSNGYQHVEDGPLEREQDLPKDDDAASAEVEKPSPRSKLPLIFTGLAIAAVGVAVASISRPH